MAPRLISDPFGARKPLKTPHRTAAFREIAREIVFKDRDDRKSGLAVDTAGAIARALERAYARGYAEAQQQRSAVAPSSVNGPIVPASEPLDWILIPPRPRDAFWTICRTVLGRDGPFAAATPGRLVPADTERGLPGWRLIGQDSPEKRFGRATIMPLVKLGLLGFMHGPNPCLAISALGQATWQRFVDRGGRFPEDLTSPSDYPGRA